MGERENIKENSRKEKEKRIKIKHKDRDWKTFFFNELDCDESNQI